VNLTYLHALGPTLTCLNWGVGDNTIIAVSQQTCHDAFIRQPVTGFGLDLFVFLGK
jgi:hypothetical protein